MLFSMGLFLKMSICSHRQVLRMLVPLSCVQASECTLWSQTVPSGLVCLFECSPPHAWFCLLPSTHIPLYLLPVGVHIYMLVYVDDIVIFGSLSDVVHHLISSMFKSFPIKDLGTLVYFLGLEASYNSEGMVLTKWRSVLNLLHRVSMDNCKPTSTSLATTERLTHDTGTMLGTDDSFRYRSIVGGLKYLTLTCLDLSFAVNKVCQFLS
jgi:hypothetical protein